MNRQRWPATACVPGEDRGTRSLPVLRASGPVAYPAASGAATTPGRARVSRAVPHTSANDSRIRPSLPLCPGPEAMDGQGARSGGRTVGHGPYRSCGPPARSLTQRPLGPLPPPVGPESLGPHHTPRPTTQESDRRCHCAQDPGRWMGKAHVRGRTVGHGPYRFCGPPARSLTQRPLGPLPPPVGPESLGPHHTPRPTTQESDRCCHCAQKRGR